ncbi:indolepyruvate ferredoxin oxidoreductase beta subunit [Thermodesulfobium acidiphilum]|uniref:Indolepyruvate ferredoxin oxidoreductase beta subunit n=1 Tax=Thermodesulfobium acidiphilum TaxID=1794699 RepID=A0A2R4W1V5_THEAF|nr:indolepyruvate oxidoreductase subunit beta [Thermodesulfobium acidiphilum]AWB10769.1 indolepyruvate ferredoxin oxidoreductase beta subunit [Thermodesulfobium acidiphilum]
MDKIDFLFVGVGGQGVLTASRLISHVGFKSGYDVKLTEVHGMAQRGGSVESAVRFARKVRSPLLSKGEVDFLVAFECMEAARYLEYLRPDGKLLVSDEMLPPLPVISGKTEYPLNIMDRIKDLGFDFDLVDALKLAKDVGNPKTINIIMIGLLSKYLDIPEDLWMESIKEFLPEKLHEINLRAFTVGRKYK